MIWKQWILLLYAGKCLAQTVAFENGIWFDGHAFVAKRVYAVNGYLTFRKPVRIESTIDLAGGYVVPPFGEAHNHNVEPLNQVGSLSQLYLLHGIFYVKNPDCLPATREKLAGRINTKSSIEVTFSNGGFTAPGGHPVELVERNIQRGIWTKADGEGAFYYGIDSAAGLQRKWALHLATHPDFIKTFLLYSEEYEGRRKDPAFFGWHGLSPEILKALVTRAHAAGLRVSTHIESAADFHVALLAGVDEINHMPGFRMYSDVRPHPAAAFEVTETDARLAARRRTVVVTTLAGARTLYPNGRAAARRRQQDALNLRNLKVLNASSVRIAIGSDSYREDSLAEVLYLESLHALDNLSLLKSWCETTVQTIFPNRKVGFLREGFEANFLVLDGDPLSDFAAVKRIRLRVKQGQVLTLPAGEVKQ